jgi:FixJ family two-component response regulator/DNA-binding winged helix-turn-helix (wHTH) protein
LIALARASLTRGPDRDLSEDPNNALTGPNAPPEGGRQFAPRGLSYQFGRFHVLRDMRQVLLEGEITELSGAVFDLLIELIESRGALITYDSLFKRLWPGDKIDVSRLWVQMLRLRAALGEDNCFIRTVPGRGYIFSTDVAVATYDDGARTHTLAHLCHNPIVASRVSDAPARRWLELPSSTLREDNDWRTVILIDDDHCVRESVKNLLRSVGLLADAFDSIHEFLANIGPRLPGCLLLDVKLPGQSGLEFFEDLANSEIHLPVIFMTGHADVPISVKAMKSGAVDFLIKPVRPQDLLNAVQLAIECASLSTSKAPRKDVKCVVHEEQSTCRGGLAPWRERRAKESMTADMGRDFSVSRVAAECGMSRTHFGQAFKRSTGMTPREWLSTQKIIKAKGLLLSGTSLAETAQQCGFSDQSHFTRVFVAMVGAPPGAWVRIHKA